MYIDLLRHGTTELGHTLRGSTDDALTAQGWQDMQATIQRATQSWQMIFSSPLQRCQNFATVLASSLNLPIHILPDLQEMHFGDWEAQSTQSLYARFPEDLAKFWQTPTQFTPPNAESIHTFATRIDQALLCIQQLMQQHKVEQALVVTHGGVIKYCQCRAAGQNLDLILTMPAALAQLHSFQIQSQQLLKVTP